MLFPLARTRRRTAALAGVIALTVGLAGCTSSPANDGPVTLTGPSTTATASSEAATGTLLSAYDLEGMDATAAIEHLETLGGADRPDALMASIRPTELLLSDASGETTLPLPDDAFYLSFAPYVSQTHDCFFHSLTTCQGEIIEQPVTVQIVDDATGETLIDETRTTEKNGFVGVWLPRDIDATLRVTLSDGELAGEQKISTREDSATCLTTLQVA